MATFATSTPQLLHPLPRHIAIIMDGNGRWAKRRFLPRVAGHKRGVETVREITRACIERGVAFLTLFAFSSENWRRPQEEVSLLRQLFVLALEQEVDKLNKNGIRLKVIGDLTPFGSRICELARRGEEVTAQNTKLTLTIAANYGGRWDLLQAIGRLLQCCPEQRDGFTEEQLARQLALNFAPEPDLFIRTGGEQRISNFLLWQLAYAELYFTPTLWPDFDKRALDEAITWFQARERRFGRTSDQVAGVIPDAAAEGIARDVA
jgi:undecaprenyl diphosphate synthase